jgi:hypothetical protein
MGSKLPPKKPSLGLVELGLKGMPESQGSTF